jgi:hypothetical protein
MKLCTAKKTDGTRCMAPAGEGGLCYFHDPKIAAKRAKARRLGGKRRRVKVAGDYPKQLKTIDDIASLYNAVMLDLLEHENSGMRARLLISLGLAYIDVLKVGEIEQRLSALEALTTEAKK